MPRKTPPPQTVPSREGGALVSLEESTLPRSIITRLAKSAIPEGSMIQKDAILAILKSSTVFVNRLCDEANEITKKNGKKTIVPADILAAIKEMDFGEFVPRMEAELKMFEEKIAAKRTAAGAKKSAAGEETADKDGAAEDADGPPAKKAKTTNGAAVSKEVAEGIVDVADDELDEEEIPPEDEEGIVEDEEEEQAAQDEQEEEDSDEEADEEEDERKGDYDEALDDDDDSD